MPEEYFYFVGELRCLSKKQVDNFLIQFEVFFHGEILGGKKAFNIKTVLISLPQMVLPIALFSIGSYYYSYLAGCLIVGLTGIFGILLKEQVFNLIIKAYKSEKYSTLKAYKQT